ncbi:integration host factor subunit beta (plasmid) [Paracoccus liaowanqingii]|uniref:Integration host factor subunit beta n=1 Tax=Paracoccus liaowanqingii TaxID=2560053 RepID=A0A4Y5SRH2_9RHOB|nr:HU family DNA-binding protein [Paracoccus liaowanqingii]QDA36097.1 integration host factor subunit beta [Paracoccus liaowanqingii]
MIRSELVRKLARTYPHLSPQVVETAVEAILNQITEGLAQGKRVEFRGFGSFASKMRKQRMGRNPRNGDPVQVEEKQVPTFRASKQLLTRLTAAGNIQTSKPFADPK